MVCDKIMYQHCKFDLVLSSFQIIEIPFVNLIILPLLHKLHFLKSLRELIARYLNHNKGDFIQILYRNYQNLWVLSYSYTLLREAHNGGPYTISNYIL